MLTGRPLPTFMPYTLDNIGAAPTSTPQVEAAFSEPDASPAPQATAEPEHVGGSGGGCFAPGPDAPIEAGSALIFLAVGSAAAYRAVRSKRDG